MKMYICGPMTGLPENNYPAFAEAEKALEVAAGMFELGNPAKNFDGRVGLPWEQYMRLAIQQVMDCTDLVRLPGWRNSKGARLEVRIAEDLGLTVWDLEDLVK